MLLLGCDDGAATRQTPPADIERSEPDAEDARVHDRNVPPPDLQPDDSPDVTVDDPRSDAGGDDANRADATAPDPFAMDALAKDASASDAVVADVPSPDAADATDVGLAPFADAAVPPVAFGTGCAPDPLWLDGPRVGPGSPHLGEADGLSQLCRGVLPPAEDAAAPQLPTQNCDGVPIIDFNESAVCRSDGVWEMTLSGAQAFTWPTFNRWESPSLATRATVRFVAPETGRFLAIAPGLAAERGDVRLRVHRRCAEMAYFERTGASARFAASAGEVRYLSIEAPAEADRTIQIVPVPGLPRGFPCWSVLDPWLCGPGDACLGGTCEPGVPYGARIIDSRALYDPSRRRLVFVLDVEHEGVHVDAVVVDAAWEATIRRVGVVVLDRPGATTGVTSVQRIDRGTRIIGAIHVPTFDDAPEIRPLLTIVGDPEGECCGSTEYDSAEPLLERADPGGPGSVCRMDDTNPTPCAPGFECMGGQCVESALPDVCAGARTPDISAHPEGDAFRIAGPFEEVGLRGHSCDGDDARPASLFLFTADVAGSHVFRARGRPSMLTAFETCPAESSLALACGLSVADGAELEITLAAGQTIWLVSKATQFGMGSPLEVTAGLAPARPEITSVGAVTHWLAGVGGLRGIHLNAVAQAPGGLRRAETAYLDAPGGRALWLDDRVLEGVEAPVEAGHETWRVNWGMTPEVMDRLPVEWLRIRLQDRFGRWSDPLHVEVGPRATAGENAPCGDLNGVELCQPGLVCGLNFPGGPPLCIREPAAGPRTILDARVAPRDFNASLLLEVSASEDGTWEAILLTLLDETGTPVFSRTLSGRDGISSVFPAAEVEVHGVPALARCGTRVARLQAVGMDGTLGAPFDVPLVPPIELQTGDRCDRLGTLGVCPPNDRCLEDRLGQGTCVRTGTPPHLVDASTVYRGPSVRNPDFAEYEVTFSGGDDDGDLVEGRVEVTDERGEAVLGPFGVPRTWVYISPLGDGRLTGTFTVRSTDPPATTVRFWLVDSVGLASPPMTMEATIP